MQNLEVNNGIWLYLWAVMVVHGHFKLLDLQELASNSDFQESLGL